MEILLEAGDDHVQRLAHENDPVRAIAELIWNGLDADAHSVVVSFGRNEADGIVSVAVDDDGHGIPAESIESSFKWIGNSWKRAAGRSLGEGRPLHGRYGQGRLRAFALGTQIVWETRSKSTDGQVTKSAIRANARTRNGFDVGAAATTDDAPGTRFYGTGRDGIDRLDTDRARASLAATLAPYLIAHSDVVVDYDGTLIDPLSNVVDDSILELSWEHDGKTRNAKLRILEWKKADGRTIHLCDGDGVPIDQIGTGPEPDFLYSAYVLWDDMGAHHNEWMLTSLEPEVSIVGALLAEVDRALGEHFDQRRLANRRALVATWKQENTYPYEGDAATPEEEVERATFDVVATSIRRHIPVKNKKQRKLTLGLLRESLQQRPSDVGELLDQFLGLPAGEREQLDRLLRRTSLSRVIQASTNVTNRLEFLRALELMVFDPETNKMVGEREHLHRILENELWIFGEQYNLMISERGLTAVLDRHLELLGAERSKTEPVRRLDGTSGRLDLLLSVAATEHDRNRHLVIELKAPKVPATLTELTQIKSYAMAAAADPRFASTTTEWDFLLITSEIDPAVRYEINQRNRPRGLASEPDLPDAPGAKVRVWVREWGEIIDDAKRRLDYFQKSLEHDPSMEDAKAYLNENHSDVIPVGLLGEKSASAEKEDDA